MPIYGVLVDISGTAYVTVEADNEADAEEVAIEAVSNGEGEIDYEPLGICEITPQWLRVWDKEWARDRSQKTLVL